MIQRLHYSCTKLHSFYPGVSSICPKCKAAEGTLCHLFWSCPKLRTFWSDIFRCLSTIHGCDITPDPLTAVLGVSHHLTTLSRFQQKNVQYCIITAKRNILTLSKEDKVPSFQAWLTDITNLLHIERVWHSVNLTSATFDKMWLPFTLYISSL